MYRGQGRGTSKAGGEGEKRGGRWEREGRDRGEDRVVEGGSNAAREGARLKEWGGKGREVKIGEWRVREGKEGRGRRNEMGSAPSKLNSLIRP